MINIVHNCDNMDFMKDIPDNYFDLIITSPPYNLGNNHHTGAKRFFPYDDNMLEHKYQTEQRCMLNESNRIIKKNGSIFYNHKNRIKNHVQITPYEWILKTDLIVKQEVIWFNRSQNFDKIRFYPMTERIYWLSKTKNTLFNNNINHHDFFRWESVGTNKKHKRAFPVELVKDILKCFPKGLKVFDPYTGSGTTRIACYELGFEFVGCELDKDYYEAQEKRFFEFKKKFHNEFYIPDSENNLFKDDDV